MKTYIYFLSAVTVEGLSGPSAKLTKAGSAQLTVLVELRLD